MRMKYTVSLIATITLLTTPLGQAVELRYTPRLKFTLDQARSRGDRVLHILDELEKESPLGQADDEGPTEND